MSKQKPDVGGNLLKDTGDWWYARFFALKEEQYQLVLELLREAIDQNKVPGDLAEKALHAMERNQEGHYQSREEYAERKELHPKYPGAPEPES